MFILMNSYFFSLDLGKNAVPRKDNERFSEE